jgi:CheY-like chemotaxis protein
MAKGYPGDEGRAESGPPRRGPSVCFRPRDGISRRCGDGPNQVGVDPFIVSDGAEAVTAWSEREWDVILMDVQMPLLDGPRRHPGDPRDGTETRAEAHSDHCPYANAMAHQLSAYAEAGMDGFVAEPIQITCLFGAIEAALAEAAPTADKEAYPEERVEPSSIAQR